MHQKKVLRISAAALVFAVTLRLVGNGFFRPVSAFLTRPETLSFLIYAQTGRVLRPVVHRPIPEPTNSTTPTQITQQSEPTETVPDAVLSFSDGDLELVEVYYYCDYDPDLQILLSSPLNIKLAGEEPTVLIVHSHGSESYSGDYKEVEPYRSLDPDLNMIAIGTEVERILELNGISVLHDCNIYDYPDYNGAYVAARASIEEYLAAYPSIQLVLDLHRDAAEGDAGQLVTSATVDGQQSAQLMLVIGTDASGKNHPNWQDNLALALKLHVLLEQENPGVTRPISLRKQRFNMDLTPGSLLIEVGAAGNTLEEALIAANALAEAIVKLSNGSR